MPEVEHLLRIREEYYPELDRQSCDLNCAAGQAIMQAMYALGWDLAALNEYNTILTDSLHKHCAELLSASWWSENFPQNLAVSQHSNNVGALNAAVHAASLAETGGNSTSLAQIMDGPHRRPEVTLCTIDSVTSGLHSDEADCRDAAAHIYQPLCGGEGSPSLINNVRSHDRTLAPVSHEMDDLGNMFPSGQDPMWYENTFPIGQDLMWYKNAFPTGKSLPDQSGMGWP